MSNSQNQINNFSAVEKSLNWIGDKLLDVKNYVEVDLATQQFIDGMNVNQNYKVIYERQNNGANSEWSVKLASKAGAIVQAYTGPSLYYTVGKLTQGLSNIFGDSVSKGMDVLIGNIDSNNSMLAAYARVGEVAGNSVANGLGKVFGWAEERLSNLDNANNQRDFLISTNSNNQTKSISATKTIDANNKATVSVSSSDYSKSELKTSSQQVLKTQSVGTKVEIEGSDGVVNGTLLNNSLIEEFNKVVNTEIKFDDNFKISDNLYLAEDSAVVLKDGTVSTLDAVLDTIDSVSNHIQSFFFSSVDFGKDLLDAVGSIFDNNRPQLFDQGNNPLYLDVNGNNTTERYHYLTDEYGNQILDDDGNPVEVENEKATGPSNMELLLADFAARVATGADIDDAALETAKTAIAREVSKDLVSKLGLNDTQLQSGIAVAVARIGVMHINGDDPNSQDYAVAAIEGILIAAGLPAAIVAGIVAATNRILEEDGKFNSDGYQDVAAIAVTTAVVAAVCIKVGAIVGSFFGPAGTVIGAVVGAVVGYLIAAPLYNSIRDGWEDSEQIYDAFEDIFKGDDIDDQIKEAIKGLEDLAKDYTIDFIRDVGRGALKLFTGRYGKELGAGEYWSPYSYLQVIAKEDGTGNKIIGVEPEGVVAIAREGYNDDLYGNSGDDNLIGKSGKNVIFGYGGNDHLEGRGEADLLIAGDGDDEVFGGNGDDQIYGGAGADIIIIEKLEIKREVRL